jgi:hypothetical protein
MQSATVQMQSFLDHFLAQTSRAECTMTNFRAEQAGQMVLCFCRQAKP